VLPLHQRLHELELFYYENGHLNSFCLVLSGERVTDFSGDYIWDKFIAVDIHD
jgi:hypothetical protein